MISVRKKQIEKIIAGTARLLYSEGVKPTNGEILGLVSKYFSENPAGLPAELRMHDTMADSGRSDVDALNDVMVRIVANLETIYEVTAEQVEEVMTLVTDLSDHVERLRHKRERVAKKLDDHILGLYNSDGYYYSVSDSFSDLSMTDVSLTSAYIDTEGGAATLPIVSRFSRRVPSDKIDEGGERHVTLNGKPHEYTDITPMSFAFDNARNTVWAFEVATDTPGEVVLVADIYMTSNPNISRVDIDPYGMTSSQWALSYRDSYSVDNKDYIPFGGRIVTSSGKFSFINESVRASNLRVTIRKTKPDYESISGGARTYRYIFGAKDIAVSYQVYDNQAVLISQPLSLDDDVEIAGSRIDAVSLVANADAPEGTRLNFYIAENVSNPKDVSDFQWSPINPVDEKTTKGNTVRFDGVTRVIKSIVDDPKSSELERIKPDYINADLSKRNPTESIIDGVKVYRLAKFTEEPLLDNIRIDEGVNTIRMYHRPLSDFAVESLEWWTDKRNEDGAQKLYSRIDAGDEFFYGGRVGESHRSVYIETYLDIPEDIDPVIASLRKMDQNSRSWKIKAFLNGNELGYLDQGEESKDIVWPFKAGLNHVVLLVNIPQASAVINTPFAGTINLLGSYDLFDYGLVKLDTWNYIDFFDMEYNQSNDAATFTIRDGELISRKNPSGNLKVSYSKVTGNGPSAVRLRADLSRKSDFSSVTPVMKDYRLRFSYSER